MIQSNSELSARLAGLNKMTIPRSVKFLKSCLNNWLIDNEQGISPPELYNLCYERAGDNGHNAFIRAFISLIRENKLTAKKFWEIIADNREAPWAKTIASAVYNSFSDGKINYQKIF